MLIHPDNGQFGNNYSDKDRVVQDLQGTMANVSPKKNIPTGNVNVKAQTVKDTPPQVNTYTSFDPLPGISPETVQLIFDGTKWGCTKIAESLGFKDVGGRKPKEDIYEKLAPNQENDKTKSAKERYKAKVKEIRSQAKDDKTKKSAGADYKELITKDGVYTISEEMLNGLFGVDLDTEFTTQTQASGEDIAESVIGQAKAIGENVGKLRNMSKFISDVITKVHRILNNVLTFDQILGGNVPFKLGTLTVGDKEIINIRHGSPLKERFSFFKGKLKKDYTAEVTPEFKAFVTHGLDKEKGEKLLYINRMKVAEGDEGPKSGAIRKFAESEEANGNMDYVALPVDGSFITQKNDFEEDKTFDGLANDLADMMWRKDGKGGFYLNTGMKIDLLKKLKPGSLYSEETFKDEIKKFFKTESEHYNNELATSGEELDREQRRALLINFVNGPLTEKIIEASSPSHYINSCKENVDRGSVGNAIHTFRNCQSGDDDDGNNKLTNRIKNSFHVLVTPVLLAKKRMVNHNLDNYELFLKYASEDYLNNPHTDSANQPTFKLAK